MLPWPRTTLRGCTLGWWQSDVTAATNSETSAAEHAGSQRHLGYIYYKKDLAALAVPLLKSTVEKEPTDELTITSAHAVGRETK